MIQEPKVNESVPLVDIKRHPFTKPCMMTIFMHDYAHPPNVKIGIWPFEVEAKNQRPPTPLEIFSLWTMEYIRDCTDEQLGKLVRETLNKLDEEKKKIEKVTNLKNKLK